LNRFFHFVLVGSLMLLVTACSSSMNVKDTSDTIVGIQNQFPDTPNYIKKRTFVFRHQVSDMDKGKFKDVITQSAGDYLISKGYKVVEVEDKSALENGRVDYIVKIIPMDIFKHDGTLGFGFYDRKILEILIKQPARSYICMDMNLYRKGYKKIIRTGRQENFSRLNIKELPDNPDQLTENEKKEMALNLEANIRKTVFKTLPILGL